jgi:hypothetical protein
MPCECERGVENVDGGKISGDGVKESTQRCGTSWRCSEGGRGAMGEEVLSDLVGNEEKKEEERRSVLVL